MRFASPPRALQAARLDNLAIVPASLLDKKELYQAVANRLPEGQVLVVFPCPKGASQRSLERVASQLRSYGYAVAVLTADMFA